MGLAQGSNVRVGLDDSLWIPPGELAQSNADQVKKIRQVNEGTFELVDANMCYELALPFSAQFRVEAGEFSSLILIDGIATQRIGTFFRWNNRFSEPLPLFTPQF